MCQPLRNNYGGWGTRLSAWLDQQGEKRHYIYDFHSQIRECNTVIKHQDSGALEEMHNVHSCVMGGSKWDSSKGLLFSFNDLLFHLVLKIRMEDLSRYFFFRRCTCWQSIPWVMTFNVLHHLQLSYWIFLFIIIMEFFIYLKNIFLQRCHTDVVHLVSVEREKKRNERKNKNE